MVGGRGSICFYPMLPREAGLLTEETEKWAKVVGKLFGARPGQRNMKPGSPHAIATAKASTGMRAPPSAWGYLLWIAGAELGRRFCACFKPEQWAKSLSRHPHV